MESTSFMKVDEVAQELGISKSYAYKIVQKLNAELKEKGFMTISGRVNELAENENVTEELKATDQMLWVRKMNNIRNRATEIVNSELIYTV